MKETIKKSIVWWIIFSSTVLIIWWTYAALSSLTAAPTDTLTANKWNALVEHAVPSWAVMAFNLSLCPTGWSKADWTENALDLRWEFIRWLDDGRGVDIGRTLASAQWDAIRNITGSVGSISTWLDALFWQDNPSVTGAFGRVTNSTNTVVGVTSNIKTNVSQFTFDASNVVPTATENRPRNVALLYCIKD